MVEWRLLQRERASVPGLFCAPRSWYYYSSFAIEWNDDVARKKEEDDDDDDGPELGGRRRRRRRREAMLESSTVSQSALFKCNNPLRGHFLLLLMIAVAAA